MASDEPFFPVPEHELRDAGMASALRPIREQVTQLRRQVIKRLLLVLYVAATVAVAVVLTKALWTFSPVLALAAGVGYTALSVAHWVRVTR